MLLLCASMAFAVPAYNARVAGDFKVEGVLYLKDGTPMISSDGLLKNKGNFIPATDYFAGDIVQSSGVSYVCIVTNKGILTTNTSYWSPLAAEGAAGPAGEAGTTGPSGVDGFNSLISMDDELFGSNCSYGGIKVQVGRDLNRNGALELNEITNSKYVCNGLEASSGHSFPFSGAMHASSAGTPPYANCTACHNTTIAGGTYSVGSKPLCSACHKDVVNLNSATRGCKDCHGGAANDGRPADASLTAQFPNRQNGHGAHTFTGVPCTACHFDFGTGAPNHGKSGNNQNPLSANVVIAPTYFAKTGDPTINGGNGYYNPATKRCNNVSCHGAKTTAPWDVPQMVPLMCNFCHNISGNDVQAGDVDPATLLANDYATPPLDQHNNAFSGVRPASQANNLHYFHVVIVNQSCLSCHNFPANASHFADLSSPIMTKSNIVDAALWGGTYTPTGNKTCSNVACHASVASTIDWLR